MAVDVFRVSERGQMALPAEARRRWDLGRGGSVEVVDLGDAIVIVPAGRGGLRAIVSEVVAEAGGYAGLAARVAEQDPDLAVSAGDVVVDDHLMLGLLLGEEPAGLRPRGGRVATTGLWYHRLCRALADQTITGAMSSRLGGVEERVASATMRSVIDLPDWVKLVSLRSLAWPMAALLTSGAHLNLLGLEALAAAEALGAELCLAAVDDNPGLRRAAEERGIPTRIV